MNQIDRQEILYELELLDWFIQELQYERLRQTSDRNPICDDCGSHWRINSTCDHGRHQVLDSQKNSFAEELHFQPAPGSEFLPLPTDYEILGPGIDLVLADLCAEKHNAMPVDENNSYLVSNTGAPRAPHFETSTITFVNLRSNQRHVSFHADQTSMLHHDILQSISDNLSHFRLLNRRPSQSRRQWLRSKGSKIPTTDVPK